jgi:tetratricopeptide (TPR) repeat protein
MWSLLAGAQRVAGDGSAALATLEQALRVLPHDPFLEADLVGQQLALRRVPPAEAARQLEALLARGATVYETYVYLGLAKMQNGEPAEAERAYRRAIGLNPSGKAAYDGLVLAILAQGRANVEHVGLREQAGFSLGGGIDRLIDGAAHLAAGRIEEAERAFKEALRISPESPVALLALAITAGKRADHMGAIELCQRAIAIAPDLVDAYQQLAMSAMALGRHDEAIEALEKAAEVSPYDKEVFNRLGVAYARAGRLDEAHRSWLKTLEIDPDHPGARHNLDRLEAASR